MITPILETSRLRLRSHRLTDFSDCFAMWSDPIVTRYIGGKPSTEQQVWMRILGYVGHWSLLGFGYWVVEDKVTGQFIGEIGFADFKRNIDESMRNIPELGWALATHAHGKGYATEAAHAAIAWADAHFGSIRTVCMIDPGNVASIRVAEKCGYQCFHQTIFNEMPMMLFERFAK